MKPRHVRSVKESMRAHLIVLAAFVLTAITAAAAEPHPLALKALDSLDSFKDEHWSYTKTTTTKDGVRVERHSAEQPEGERWALVRVNGNEPTAQERETYRSEKSEEVKRRKNGEGRDDESNDVDRGSIRLIDETAERATFNFRTVIDGRIGSKLEENILGTLVVHKNGAWAERFELESTGTLKPIPGVKVSTFNIKMTFQPHAASGAIVPDEIEMHVRGRAFLVKSLDQDRTSRFSDFERVH